MNASNGYSQKMSKEHPENNIMTNSRVNHQFLVLAIALLISACDSTASLSPEQHMQNARNFVSENNIDAAIIEIKNALQKDSNLSEGRFLLGSVYLQRGLGATAEKEFLNARELGYVSDELVGGILQSYILQRKFEEVLSETNERSQTGDLSAKFLTLRGDAFLGLNQISQAESSFKQALELDNSSIEARLGLARILMANNNFGEAKRLIGEAEALAPQEISVLLIKGELALRENNPEAAELAYIQATAISDYDIGAQFGLIRSLVAQNKSDEALEALNRVDALAPNHPMGNYFRGIIAVRNNEMELARTHLLEVLNVIPNHAESLLMIAQISYNEGKIEQSQGSLNAFLAQYPSHADALKLQASIEISLNKPTDAITTIQKIIDTQGEDPQLLIMLSRANLEAGNTNVGIELLERTMVLAPENIMIDTQLAAAYLNQGAVARAITTLENAIIKAPDLLQPRVLLVATYLRNKDFDAAITAATDIINLQPDNANAYNLLGSAYKSSDKNDLAREQFERALVIDSKFIPALYNLAQLDIAQDKPDTAEINYRKILEIDPNHVDTLLELARLESTRGEIDKMLALVEQAWAGNPGAVRAGLILGRHYLATGDAKKLLDVATESAKAAPMNDEVQFLLGQAQRMNGMINESLSTLTALQSKAPDSPALLYELANVQMQLVNNDLAREYLNKVLRQLPDHPGALSASIVLAIRENDHDLARNQTRLLQNLQPDSPATYALTGDTFFSENRFDEAIDAYEKAYSTAQTFTLTAKLSQAYEMSGDSQKAKSILDEWLEKNKEDLGADLLLAGIYMREDNKESAIRHYESVLAKDAENTVALNNLSWLYVDTNLSRAYELAVRANNIVPDSNEIMDTLGWILVKQGKFEQGLSMIRRALQEIPESQGIRYHLAYALASSGDEELARNELAIILDSNNDFEERASAEELLRSLN